MKNYEKASKTDLLVLTILSVSLIANIFLGLELRTYKALSTSDNVLAGDSLTTSEMQEIAADNSPSFGPKHAPVTLVLFTDFQCPFCKSFASTLRQLEDLHRSDLRVVIREMPLRRHPYARKEAEVSECVAMLNPASFRPVYDFIYSRDIATDQTEAALKSASLIPGFDSERVSKCVRDHESVSRIDHDIQLATKYHVTETPYIFVNGIRVRGAMRRIKALDNLIREQRERAR